MGAIRRLKEYRRWSAEVRRCRSGFAARYLEKRSPVAVLTTAINPPARCIGDTDQIADHARSTGTPRSLDRDHQEVVGPCSEGTDRKNIGIQRAFGPLPARSEHARVGRWTCGNWHRLPSPPAKLGERGRVQRLSSQRQAEDASGCVRFRRTVLQERSPQRAQAVLGRKLRWRRCSGYGRTTNAEGVTPGGGRVRGLRETWRRIGNGRERELEDGAKGSADRLTRMNGAGKLGRQESATRRVLEDPVGALDDPKQGRINMARSIYDHLDLDPPCYSSVFHRRRISRRHETLEIRPRVVQAAPRHRPASLHVRARRLHRGKKSRYRRDKERQRNVRRGFSRDRRTTCRAAAGRRGRRRSRPGSRHPPGARLEGPAGGPAPCVSPAGPPIPAGRRRRGSLPPSG